jgi:hypothetical protein
LFPGFSSVSIDIDGTGILKGDIMLLLLLLLFLFGNLLLLLSIHCLCHGGFRRIGMFCQHY